ncbi:hypothetical protein Purlil1_12846 [Purpureocillium lilacinum]|uniref:amidase n=1 Tax=Purpureocillium lilacinum TaxID=33203 RepID=A0ABR0BFN7_PURLI|nr:hypothetical protein Purlil1_12846 [Purpureocillium lilacinum]
MQSAGGHNGAVSLRRGGKLPPPPGRLRFVRRADAPRMSLGQVGDSPAISAPLRQEMGDKMRANDGACHVSQLGGKAFSHCSTRAMHTIFAYSSICQERIPRSQWSSFGGTSNCCRDTVAPGTKHTASKPRDGTMDWQAIVAEKCCRRAAILDAVIPQVTDTASDSNIASILGDEDIGILTARMAKGEITAQAVVLEFIRREPLFADAIEQAKGLDEYFERTGRLLGPLHGIPISVKDQFNVEGVDTTLGYVARSFKPANHNAALVTILKRLGAITIAKTTIPQSILWGETENPLWGLTTYPNNPSLTPGGSSGGEAALLALFGSVCGWGTDIGGSVRFPSHLCGLFGPKPSSSRFPYAGVPVSQEGQNLVPSSIGRMSRHLSALIPVTKECPLSRPWILDPSVVPLPWREDAYQEVQTRRLKIGVILDDGVTRPHPEIQLAVRSAIVLFEQAGHTIIAWDTSDHLDCIKIMNQFHRTDGGEDVRSEVEAAGEPLTPHLETILESRPIKHNNKWNASARLDETNPEAVQTSKWMGYAKIWNFLDYTAMSFPLTRFGSDTLAEDYPPSEIHVAATTAREGYQHGYKPRNAWDEWNHQLYHPESMYGLPIGLQIIGRRFEEEKVLGVAMVLQNLVQTKGRISRGIS